MKTGIVIVIFIVSSFSLSAQHLFIIGNDTTRIYEDSIAFIHDNPYLNTKWEFLSRDKWVTLSEDANLSLFLSDSIMYFRGVTFDSVCRQRITDTIKVEAMKPVIVNGNEFNCDQKGGYFLLFDSVYIIIPDSALETLTKITVNIHTSFNGKPFWKVIDNPERKFLFGIEVQGDHPFDKYAIVKIQTSLIPQNQILQLFAYNNDKMHWNFYNTHLLFSSNKKYVKTSFGLGMYAIFSLPIINYQLESEQNYSIHNILPVEESQRQKLELKKVVQDPPNACKNGIIDVAEESIDLNKDNCEVVVNKSTVLFVECGNTKGGVVEQQIGKECVPEINCRLLPDVIKKNDKTELICYVNVAGYPLAHLLVYINPGVQVAVDKYATLTNGEGKAVFTITGTSEALPAEIEYNVRVEYYLTSQLAYDTENGKEFNFGEKVDYYVSGKLKLIIIDECTDPAKINCSEIKYGALCEKYKESLPYKIVTDPEYVLIDKGDFTFITLQALDIKNNIVPMPQFTARSLNPRIAGLFDVSGNILIAAGYEEGETTFGLRWCNNDNLIGVKVEGDDCSEYMDDIDVIPYPKSLKMLEGAHYRLKTSYKYKNGSPDTPNYIPMLRFTSSNSCISVSKLGVITAKKKGKSSVIITWCKKSDNKSFRVEVPVEVVDICQLTKVKITPQTVTIEEGRYKNAEVEYEFLNDSITGGGGFLFIPKITWESQNEQVATVDSLGCIYGRSFDINWGFTNIIARICDNDSIVVPVGVYEPNCHSDGLLNFCDGQLILGKPFCNCGEQFQCAPYRNCDGKMVGSLQSFVHQAGSSGGTFWFYWDLKYRVIYNLLNGVVDRKFVEISGSITVKGGGTTYFNKYLCELNGITECLTHIKFELNEYTNAIQVSCSYGEPYSEVDNFDLKYYDIWN